MLDRAERAIHRRILGEYSIVYWLRISCATWCAIASTSVDFLGEERLPARGLGQIVERLARACRFAMLFLGQQADAVDQHVALVRALQDACPC